MNNFYVKWMRLQLWWLEHDIVQIEHRQQVLRGDLAELKQSKHRIELEIFAAEHPTS